MPYSEAVLPSPMRLKTSKIRNADQHLFLIISHDQGRVPELDHLRKSLERRTKKVKAQGGEDQLSQHLVLRYVMALVDAMS